MRLPWRRRDPDGLACREAVEFIADFLDDVLPPAAASRLLRHLARCGDCSEYLAQLRLTRDLARRGADGDSADGTDGVDEATRRAVLQLYRDWRGG